jgi:hypothetical protein
MQAMMYFQIIIVFLAIFIPSGAILTANTYVGTTSFAYGQTIQTNSSNSNPP